MATLSISGLYTHIRDQEIRLGIKNLELEDVIEQRQSHASTLNRHFIKLQAIDPSLVGSERTSTTSKIIKIAFDIFYSIKKGLFRLFTPLNRQIRDYQHLTRLIRELNGQEDQLRHDINTLASDVVASKHMLSRLESEQRHQAEQSAYDPGQAFDFENFELGWKDFAPEVVVSAIDKAKSVFNFVSSFFSKTSVAVPETLTRRDSEVSTASSGSFQTAAGDDAEVEQEDLVDEATLALEELQRQNVQKFKTELFAIATGWDFDDETALALKDNFFPNIENAERNLEMLARGIIAYDLEFTSASCMNANLRGLSAQFETKEKLTIEFDHSIRAFELYDNKFAARTNLGTFGLQWIWAENGLICMKGKPLTGPLSYFARKDSLVTITRDEFLELFNENKFRPL